MTRCAIFLLLAASMAGQTIGLGTRIKAGTSLPGACLYAGGNAEIFIKTAEGLKWCNGGTWEAVGPATFALVTHQFLQAYDGATGLFAAAQPDTSDIVGFPGDATKYWDGTGSFSVPAGGGGGSGTVTSFSAGTLSPLFTTSVATATTTPALTFSLSNAAAHTFFGNATGSTGAPSFSSIGLSDLPGSGATTVNGQTCTLGSTCTVSGGGDVLDGGLANHGVAIGDATTHEVKSIAVGTAGQYVRSGGAGVDPAMASIIESEVTNLVADLAAKAPLASPALTGTPTAPTAASSDSSTKVATTAFVQSAIIGSGLVPTAVSASVDWPPGTGTAYDEEGVGPLDVKWSWINQGATVLTFAGSSLILTCVEASTSHDITRGIVQSLPAGDWEFRAKMANGSDIVSSLMEMLVLRESATNKIISIGTQVTGPAGSGAVLIDKRTWTPGANSTFVASYYSNNSVGVNILTNFFKFSYFKVVRASGFLSWYASPDGVVYHLLSGPTSVTDYFTSGPDQIGFAINVFSSTATPTTVGMLDWLRRIS